MAEHRSVDVVDGVAVVRHHADAADAGRLCRVGERLLLAAHPAVVQVLSSRSMGDGWELVTVHGGSPVASVSLPSGAQIASLGAQLARALSDLHARGVVHGGIDGTHVLVGTGGPLLCGFGPDDQGATAADDVAALVRLLRGLADGLEPRDRADRDAVAEVRALLSQDGEGRTARRLAADLSRPTPLRRRRVPALAAACAGLVALGAIAVAGSGGETSTPASTPDEPPTSAHARPDCVATRDRVVAGDCGFTAHVDGGAVLVDGVRTVLGHGDDEIVVGDWDCDGTPEPALLRPGSGEVLVFGAVDATGGRPVVRTHRVPGAVGLAVTEGAGCPSLAVRTGGDEVVPVS